MSNRTRTTAKHRRFARTYCAGRSITQSLIQAGYSRAQARKGLATVRKSKPLLEALREEMAQFPPEVRAGLVRRRLIENVLDGTDRAVQSCKLLGQDRELGLWEPDQQSNWVVIPGPEFFDKLPPIPEPHELPEPPDD